MDAPRSRPLDSWILVAYAAAMNEDLFATDFQPASYWAQYAGSADEVTTELPDEVDVVVVGAGYTGLHAALQTARSGLGTLVLDADSLGGGCSSRNGGQVSGRVKGSFAQLKKKHGYETALELYREGPRAMKFLAEFIATEQINCDWQHSGHFSGAHNPAAYTKTANTLGATPKEAGLEWHMVSKSEQRSEIGSDRYHGGVVYPEDCALDPGRYCLELLKKVQTASAQTIGHCPVEKISRVGNRFEVTTSRGVVRAGKVAVATNGYTGSATPWLQRRVIPIGSYIIATEPMDLEVASELAPNNRTMTDTRKLVFYYRLSPDKQRLLFGGRVALTETNPRASAPALHAAMSEIFPQLATMQISHSWYGFVGYTFDSLPHIGEHEGVHYAMGYCGSGISMSSYLGSLLGKRLSGQEQRSVFTEAGFPTRPLYSGRPWFLKPSLAYYQLRDRLPL